MGKVCDLDLWLWYFLGILTCFVLYIYISFIDVIVLIGIVLRLFHFSYSEQQTCSDICSETARMYNSSNLLAICLPAASVNVFIII